MLSEKLQNLSDEEFAYVIDADFSNAKKEERESIDLNQEAKELIKAKVEISPENFSDSRQAEAWLERVSRLVKEIIIKNLKRDRDNNRPLVDQNKFDQYYLGIIEKYKDSMKNKNKNKIKKQIKNIKDLLRKLVDSENIGENKKE